MKLVLGDACVKSKLATTLLIWVSKACIIFSNKEQTIPISPDKIFKKSFKNWT